MPISTETPLAVLARHHDMALQTRKRDGTWITTPVNPLVEDEHVYFRTWDSSGKAKRLRHFPDVRFASSTARGRATGEWMRGHATLLEGTTPRTPPPSSTVGIRSFRESSYASFTGSVGSGRSTTASATSHLPLRPQVFEFWDQ